MSGYFACWCAPLLRRGAGARGAQAVVHVGVVNALKAHVVNGQIVVVEPVELSEARRAPLLPV